MIALALVAACGDAKNESDAGTGESSSSEASSSGGDESSSTAAGSHSTTGSEPPDPITGLVPSTGGSEGGETSTTGTTGEATPEGLCAAVCEHRRDCMVDAPETCESVCLQDLEMGFGGCLEALLATLECLTGMTCEELALLDEAGEPGVCAGPLAKQDALCGEECGAGGGGDIEGTFCEWMEDCPGRPKLEMKCDTEFCECFEDGQKFGSCVAEDVCLDIGQLDDKMSACCGV